MATSTAPASPGTTDTTDTTGTTDTADTRSFLLTRVQPALSGLMDGSAQVLPDQLRPSFLAVTVGGAIIASLSAALGSLAAG